MSIAHKYIPGRTDYATEATKKELKDRIEQIETDMNDEEKQRSPHFIERISKERTYLYWELAQREAEEKNLELLLREESFIKS